ncbi:MAG: HAD-IA family hydrolase [Acidobacteriota bacterium]|jgi:phosphoglycolate phosphatase|nr:HAD-IA family hydrolase [Acidobacteriota bacterium]NLT33502.1 HAD-IA family hydrolase [Acidobacteriota bacterium]
MPTRESCRLFLFDLDGTLIDSQQDIVQSLNLALGRMRLPALSPARIRAFVGDGVQVLIERALAAATGRSPDPEETALGLELFREEYGRHLLDHTRLYPGVGAALGRLRWARCAVVSNKPADFCRRILAGLGIAGRFEIILGGDSTRHRKPDPEPLLEAMRFCRVPAAEVVMVGDSRVDIDAGRAAGVFTCGVLGGFRTEAELASCGCDLLIRSVAELPDHFRPPE